MCARECGGRGRRRRPLAEEEGAGKTRVGNRIPVGNVAEFDAAPLTPPPRSSRIAATQHNHHDFNRI